MGEPSGQAKVRACELANANTHPGHDFWRSERIRSDLPMAWAFARFIQDVSDAAKAVDSNLARCYNGPNIDSARDTLAPFILAGPGDPLEEVLARWRFTERDVENVREELAKRGLSIVETSHVS